MSEAELTEDIADGVHEKDDDDGILVKEEEREEGVVKFSVYKMYWQSVGVILAPLILLSLFLMQGKCNTMIVAVSVQCKVYLLLVDCSKLLHIVCSKLILCIFSIL